MSPCPQTSGTVESAASTLRCSPYNSRVSVAVALAPSSRPSVSCVRKGEAGRTPTLSSTCASAWPRRAANFSGTGPSDAFALTRNSPTPSFLSAMSRSTPAAPTSVNPAPSCAVRRIGPLPPVVLLKTPTLTMNSSPGDVIVGTFGVRMKSPFTSVAASATPTRRALTRDGDDAQLAVEVVGDDVVEVAAGGSDVDDARTNTRQAACASC